MLDRERLSAYLPEAIWSPLRGLQQARRNSLVAVLVSRLRRQATRQSVGFVAVARDRASWRCLMTRHWTRGELAAVIEDAQSTNPGRIADAILAAGVLGDAFDLGVRTWAEYLQAPRTGPMPGSTTRPTTNTSPPKPRRPTAMADHSVSYEDGCRFPCNCAIGANHTRDGGLEDLTGMYDEQHVATATWINTRQGDMPDFPANPYRDDGAS